MEKIGVHPAAARRLQMQCLYSGAGNCSGRKLRLHESLAAVSVLEEMHNCIIAEDGDDRKEGRNRRWKRMSAGTRKKMRVETTSM